MSQLFLKRTTLLLWLALTLIYTGCTRPADNSSASVESPTYPPFPAFNLYSPDGATVGFNPVEQEGPAVIGVWSAKWDPNYQKSIELLNELTERYGAQDVRVISIVYDNTSDPAQVKQIINDNLSQFEVAIGAKETFDNIDLKAVPTYWVINPQGTTVLRLEGHQEATAFSKTLDELINPSPVDPGA